MPAAARDSASRTTSLSIPAPAATARENKVSLPISARLGVPPRTSMLME